MHEPTLTQAFLWGDFPSVKQNRGRFPQGLKRLYIVGHRWGNCPLEGEAPMATYFENPVNGYVEKATGSWTWLWAFLFGPFYLAYKGAWPHVLVYLLVLLFSSEERRVRDG